MEKNKYRPTLPVTRIMLYVAGVLVLAIGFSLYIFTSQTDRYFAWTVASLLTAAFLGGSYWSAAVLEFLSGRERLWVNTRPSIPTVTIFTFLTLIVTLLHVDKFQFNALLLITRFVTWVWLLVYLLVPVILTILFVRQIRAPGMDPPRRFPLTRWVRWVLVLLAAVFLLLGTALLIVPLTVAPIWPWPLSPLTGRAIGAWFIGIGVATGQAAWENDLIRVRGMMASLSAFSLLQFLVLARYENEVDLSHPTAWIYVIVLFLLGLIGVSQSLKARAIVRKKQNAS
jgi:hypothetical protein